MDNLLLLKDTLEELGDGFEQFKSHIDSKIEVLEKRTLPFQSNGSSTIDVPEMWLDTKSRKPVPVLTHKMRVADLHEAKSDLPKISVGRMLRGMVLGNRADDRKELQDEQKALGITPDTSGGYTVPSVLSGTWIDLLRAQMVLSRAGARTTPMTGKDLTLARVESDPTVAWHAENADIDDTEPTFGAVTLSAKTVVGLVKFSIELAQDSANIEQILQSTLTAAIANAIDSAGLNGVTVDAATAPGGIFNLTGRNTVTGIGAPTNWDFLLDGMYELLADNVAMTDIGALIAHPKLWKKMAKLKTGITSDATPLPMPAEVAALSKLWTTAAPLASGTTAKGIIADWRDLLFGVRQDIQVRVLSETFMGSNLQLAVLVYARCDFAAARAESFCSLEGLTV